MFDDDFHLGVIGEASILLLEAKMGRVKVYDERRRLFKVFLQDVGSGFHLRSTIVSQYVAGRDCCHCALPYGSGRILPIRRSLSVAAVFDNDLCNRVVGSPGFCASFFARFRGPLLELFR